MTPHTYLPSAVLDYNFHACFFILAYETLTVLLSINLDVPEYFTKLEPFPLLKTQVQILDHSI